MRRRWVKAGAPPSSRRTPFRGSHRPRSARALLGGAAGLLLAAWAWGQSAPAPIPDPPGLAVSDRVRRDAERPMYWIRKLGEHSAAQDRPPPDKAAERPAPPRPVAPVAVERPTRAAPVPSAAPEPARAASSALQAVAAAASASLPASATAAPSGTATATAIDPPPRLAPAEAPSSQAAAPPAPRVAEAVTLRPGEILALPDALMRRLRRGAVEVRVEIGPDGQVLDAVIVQSSHPRLEQPALEATRAAHFQPVARPTSAVIQFDFDLDS